MTNYKVYAIQVAPEHQESPCFLFDDGETYQDITITGNKNYNGRKSDIFEEIVGDRLEELAGAVNDILSGEKWHDIATVSGALQELMPPKHKEKYSPREVKQWKDLLQFDYEAWRKGGYSCYEKPQYETNDGICQALLLVTGKKYTYTTIHGCSQGDWQDVFYPADDYSDKFIKNLETEYFNTGTMKGVARKSRKRLDMRQMK